MTDRRIDGFFYGLLMDSDVLQKSQIVAVNPRQAYVDNFALQIGDRATLVPTPGARAYGMVYAMTDDELARLYSAPGLEQYRVETLVALTPDGESLAALCYILQDPPLADKKNEAYARQLRAALGKLGFPPEYVASVE